MGRMPFREPDVPLRMSEDVWLCQTAGDEGLDAREARSCTEEDEFPH